MNLNNFPAALIFPLFTTTNTFIDVLKPENANNNINKKEKKTNHIKQYKKSYFFIFLHNFKKKTLYYQFTVLLCDTFVCLCGKKHRLSPRLNCFSIVHLVQNDSDFLSKQKTANSMMNKKKKFLYIFFSS